MKYLLSIISAALGAMRTVFEKCARTGKWIVRTVTAPFAVGGGAIQADDPAPQAPERDGLAVIRQLAGAIAGDRVTEADLAHVGDDKIEWLAAMDRRMLAKILYANDTALKAHIRGERNIRGVLAADRKSVAAYQYAMSVAVTDEPEEIEQPIYGMAA